MTVKFHKTLFFIDVLLPLMDKHSTAAIKAMPNMITQISMLYSGNIDDGFKNWRREGRDLEKWRKGGKKTYAQTFPEKKEATHLEDCFEREFSEKIKQHVSEDVKSVEKKAKKKVEKTLKKENEVVTDCHAPKLPAEEESSAEKKEHVITFSTAMAEIVFKNNKEILDKIAKDRNAFAEDVVKMFEERKEVVAKLKAKREQYIELAGQLQEIKIQGISFKDDDSKQILNEMESIKYIDEFEGRGENGATGEMIQREKTATKEQYVNSFIQISNMIHAKLSVINSEIKNLKDWLKDIEDRVKFYENVNRVDLGYGAKTKMQAEIFKILVEADNFAKEKDMTQIGNEESSKEVIIKVLPVEGKTEEEIINNN